MLYLNILFCQKTTAANRIFTVITIISCFEDMKFTIGYYNIIEKLIDTSSF